MSDWIEWGGGVCPVDPDAIVDVRFRDGDCTGIHSAGVWDWSNSNTHNGGDIVAYRLHGSEPIEKEPTQTATEKTQLPSEPDDLLWGSW